MDLGWIGGRIGRIRWIPQGARWMRIFGGASLAMNWVVPPLLDAARCVPCGVGIFAYDPDVYG